MAVIDDLKLEPYWDDYSPEQRDFLRILFRPGYAVQARELNQLQSILQTQVERFGNHIFKDGSIVIGGMTTIDVKSAKYLKIQDNYPTSSSTEVDVNNFLNKAITGATSGAKGIVTVVVDNDGADPKTLIYKSTNGLSFTDGELIKVDGEEVRANLLASSATGLSSTVSIDSGIFYTKGIFVINNAQTTYLEKYSNTPSRKAGLLSTVSIVTENDDDTLLDNANGSYNYAAPGAHRLKIDLVLASKEIGYTTDTNKFIELLEVRNGELYKQITKPIYAEIEKTLARRTFDESGDYTVKPFLLNIDEYPGGGATGVLRAYLEPGKAYVKGYEFETISKQYVDVKKARTTSGASSFNVPMNYGNYVLVQLGGTNANGGPVLDSATNPYSKLTIKNSAGTTLGTCRAASIKLHDSTTSPFIYKLYLFDISLISGSGFSGASGLFTAGSTGPIVIYQNPGTIYDISDARLVFETGYDSVSSLSNNDFEIVRNFTATMTSNATTVSTGDALQSFKYYSLGSTGLSNTYKNDAYIVVDNTTGDQLTNYNLTFSSGQSATFTFASQSNPITIYAKIDCNNYTQRQKTKVGVRSHYGNASTGSTGIANIVLASDASSTDDYYNNCKIKLLSGTGASSDIYTIADYIGSSRSAILVGATAFTAIPDTTTFYQIGPAITGATGSTVSDGYVYSGSTGVINFGVPDGLRLIKVLGSSSQITTNDWFDPTKDITYKFTFDNGQRDYYYDYASIKLNSNETPSTYMAAFFEYFTSTNSGYFSVNSYPDYTQVPNYISSDGKIYDLRNCVDFRPHMSAATGIFKDNYLPSSLTDFDTDITYYLPRIDKIVATTDRNFQLLEGIPSENPKAPKDIDNAMSLYTLYVNPYTFNRLDVIPSYIENKRYTMRDIGKIEERLTKIEYYTLLNALEKDTADLDVVDAAGNDRFKNGFIVDSFKGHGIGDVFNPDYKCAIDYKNQEARPKFTTKPYGLYRVDGETSGCTQIGPFTTASFTEASYINQPLASGSISVNPFSVFSYRGKIDLSPSVDYWKDESFRPTNIINIENTNDNLVYGTNWSGSHHNAHEENWNGTSEDDKVEERLARGELGADKPAVVIPLFGPGSPYDPAKWVYEERNGVPTWVSYITGETSPAVLGSPAVATPTKQAQNITGTKTSNTFVPPTINTTTSTSIVKLGDRVLDVNNIPYMRKIDITVNAYGLKPNTTVYPFFDDVNVSAYVKPNGGSYGGALTTNEAGTITNATFTIPEGTFLCGERIFRLTDSQSNNRNTEETHAESTFIANGIFVHKQTDELNIRTSTRCISSPDVPQPIDPLAQTFFVDPVIYPEGLFISAVDLFFASKPSNTAGITGTTPLPPVTVQIRPTVNGYPSSTKVLPFAESIKQYANVNTSTTAATATKFSFPALVYLEPGEYSIVILSNSKDYKVYYAQIGELKLGGSDKITEQPYVGSFFTSQNSSTWTAEQTKDLKFKLYKCNFTSGNFELVLSDQPTGTFTTKSISCTTTNGSSLIVASDPTGIAVGQSVSGTNIGGSATVVSIAGKLITLSANSTGTGTSSVTFTGKPSGTSYGDTIWTGLSTLEFKNAYTKSFFKSKDNSTGTLDASWNSFIPSKNYEFSSRRVVSVNSESYKHKIIGTVVDTNISPVIDMEKNHILTIKNEIGTAAAATNETNASGGDASSRYITRKITLQDPANYLKVYLTAVRQFGTDIKVYYKVKSEADSTLFNTKPWVEMTKEYPGSNTYSKNSNEFIEYVYYPTVSSPTTSSNVKYTFNGTTYDSFKEFSIKIVFVSDNPCLVPRIADFRAIALDAI